MAAHYIITDDGGIVLRGFSSDFEQPAAEAVCICAEGGRHFELSGVVNPPLIDDQGRYRYKLVDDCMVERTPEELAADVLSAQVSYPTLEERTAALETATQQQAATLDEVVTILEAIV